MEILAEHQVLPYDHWFPIDTALVLCSKCKNTLLATREPYRIGDQKAEWSNYARLWPEPEEDIEYFDPKMPDDLYHLLKEATKCYNARAYKSSRDVCLELAHRLADRHKIKGDSLDERLKELFERRVINDQVYKFGEVLTRHRNLRALEITKEEALLLLGFVHEMCKCIYF